MDREAKGKAENGGLLLNPGREGAEASLLSPSHAGLGPKLVPRQEGSSCLPGIQDRGQLDFALWGLLKIYIFY